MAFANPIVLSSPLSSIPIIYRERQYRYDPKYQLKSEMLWSAKVPGARSDALLWTYDGNGNRLTQHDDGILTDYVYGSNNEMTDAGSDAFTFDNFGNTASIVGVETYSYDFESHMTQREASGGSTDTHEYDGDGRRMRSKLDDASDWTNFIHDELTENLICEYTLVSGTFTIKALNTYGLGLISSNRQGTIRYFHFDGLGTTYHLTDTSQTVTDSYSYDAFGVPTSATGSSTNPYRYVGQWGYYDDGAMGSTSEMLLLGVRYYWPKYGRFTVWDALTSLAAYQYAINCPTHLTDPSGYIAVHPCRTRTASYCADARRKNGTSRANNCFCYVSWFICNQIAPSDGSAPIIGAAFLDCLNRCIFREYTLKRSDRWAKAKRSCDHYGADTIRCCVDMIRAEQAGFTDCLFSCNRLKGAGPKPRWWFYCTPDNPLSPSPFPFGSDENTRASKGIDLCCYGPYGGGAWKDLA
jgi:RHS repeat-associated protein